jgi:putative ATP-binding cassette transporter
MNAQGGPIDRLVLLRFVRAIRTFATSEVGGNAKRLAATLMVLLLGINGLNVLNSYVGRDFFTAIERRSLPGFMYQATLYVGVFMMLTAVAVLSRFVEERLGILWREWLTRRLLWSYLEHPIYYRLTDQFLANGEVANPDQRIADDVRSFTTTTISFVLLLVNATVTVVAFSSVMWSISPRLFGVAVAYAAIGSLFTILLGRPLMGLNYRQADKEAELRSTLIYVGANAESLALLRHEGWLRARLLQYVDAVTSNFRRIIAVNRNVGFFTTGYNYLIQIIPALVVAPLFIRGEVEFGVITQSAVAFGYLLGAFSLIVTQFQSISSFAAVVARLGALAEGIETAQAVSRLTMENCSHRRRTAECPICLAAQTAVPARPTIAMCEEDGHVTFDRLTLRSPQDGRTLIADLSISIPYGMRVLIRGGDATAKGALLRATAGIWECGDGRIVRPAPNRIMFLPERPHLPAGTLREQLTPPVTAPAPTDEQIVVALRAVHLDPLLDRIGGLDTAHDWDAILSLGEQQLIACARLLLAAPQFAFLDRVETTLSSEQCDDVLSALADRAITAIAFEHIHTLGDRYDAVLMLAADGHWTWTPPTSPPAGDGGAS